MSMMLVNPLKSGIISWCLKALEMRTMFSRISDLNSALSTICCSLEVKLLSFVSICDSLGSDLEKTDLT